MIQSYTSFNSLKGPWDFQFKRVVGSFCFSGVIYLLLKFSELFLHPKDAICQQTVCPFSLFVCLRCIPVYWIYGSIYMYMTVYLQQLSSSNIVIIIIVSNSNSNSNSKNIHLTTYHMVFQDYRYFRLIWLESTPSLPYWKLSLPFDSSSLLEYYNDHPQGG